MDSGYNRDVWYWVHREEQRLLLEMQLEDNWRLAIEQREAEPVKGAISLEEFLAESRDAK